MTTIQVNVKDNISESELESFLAVKYHVVHDAGKAEVWTLMERNSNLDILEMEDAVDVQLIRFGIPQNVKGFKYLREAILLMHKKPLQYITKELYPAVGSKYGIDGTRVERCIRNAIDIAWKNRNAALWDSCFPAAGAIAQKPKNSEFILALAGCAEKERLKSQQSV